MIELVWDEGFEPPSNGTKNPLPYHLATPHFYFYSTPINTNIGIGCSSIPAPISIEIGCCYDSITCRCRIKMNLLIITYNSIKILYVRYDSFYSHLRIEGFLIEGVQRKRKILRPTFPSFFIFPLYQ